ncbi:radical SAM protein [Treponema sp. OttesenSCG-928-L16]|nr:radical SAM protein [Treponema sp. OttesenSCG-928-L16]
MHFKEYKGILSPQNGMNISRGCTHGCIYCDARSTCYSMDHDFEDVEIKINAPQLLEDRLRRKRKKAMIGTGAMSDPYIPLKENLANIRRCLEIIEEYGFGLSIQTKSNLILRDLDILKRINKKAKCIVQMTLTTHDEALCKIVEPHVSSSRQRFETLKIMHENHIETVVWLSPILPYINDTKENINGILDYCIEAKVHGIICFEMGLTLREGNREHYYKKLDEHFPGLRQQYEQRYGNNYIVTSGRNRELMEIFFRRCREHTILSDRDEVFRCLRTFPDNTGPEQPSLF